MSPKRSHIDERHLLDEQTEMLLKQLEVPSSGSNDAAWEAISKAIASKPSSKVRRLFPTAWVAAASIVILLSVGFGVLTRSTRIISAKGEHVAVVLPDGSNVILNSESELSYKKYLWWHKREVKLKGEGFFKVKKGERFEVRTGNYVTSVLGTTFNVFARNDQIRVSCFTGKVGVREEQSGTNAILTPGLGVSSSGSSLGTVEQVSEKQKGWMSGEFYFTDEPLSNVFAEIERQFNVKISCKGCENRRYSGYFNDKDLGQALELVCVPMQLEYKITSENEVQVNPIN